MGTNNDNYEKSLASSKNNIVKYLDEVELEGENTVSKIGKILKFTVTKGKFPKSKHEKEWHWLSIANKSNLHIVRDRVQRIVDVHSLDLTELSILAEIKTHKNINIDSLLLDYFNNTVGYMIQNKSDYTMLITIDDPSMSLGELSRMDIRIDAGETKIISSLTLALIVMCCQSSELANAEVRMKETQSNIDRLISLTGMKNIKYFITVEKNTDEDEIPVLFID